VQRAQSAPHGESELRYPGTCRGRFSSLEQAERASGRQPGLRFLVPDPPGGLVTLRDGIAGVHTADVGASIGDFLVARRGGAPAYQLAVVVDDAAQGVTEVVRGDDLLGSTPRQILLQRALSLPTPGYWHVPLVTDPAGRRLAKRSDDLALAELRARGTDARAIVAWAARSSGFTVPSRISPHELLADFSMARLARHPVAVSPEDVDALIRG
jgi:glutamyl-tRNA synthetase